MSEQTATERAAQEYLDRQNRTTHPAGNFDGGGRWYPKDNEKCGCCKNIRTPSRGYPYSLLTHCRTAEHVANLYGVDVTELRRMANKIRKATTEQPQPKSGSEAAYNRTLAEMEAEGDAVAARIIEAHEAGRAA